MKGVIKKEFAGKVRGFAFNMLTWEIVEDLTNLPLVDFLAKLKGDKDRMKTIRIFFFASLSSYAEMEGEVLDLTERQVGCHMNLNDNVLVDLMSCMAESMDTGKQIEGEPSKKKSGLKT